MSVKIRYYLPEAGEVFLGWGINDWAVVPEEIRPAGTTVKNRVMLTPMAREDDTFEAKIRVPFGATIDYGFLITKKRNGTAIKAIWDGNQDYHMTVRKDSTADVQATLMSEQRELLGIVDESQLVTQQIWYRMPEAGEVFLVWGVDGWTLVPERIRPPGTVVKKGVMHTPMLRVGDTFIARVRVLPGAIIHYAFLITKTRKGNAIEVLDTKDKRQGNVHTVKAPGGIAEVHPTLTPVQEMILRGVTGVRLVTSQIRYYLPEAGEVFLGWGIDGWAVVPEEIRPAGTTVKNSVMNTPMAREDDTFVAKVRVPFGSTIDYGFLITKKRNGAAIKAIWDDRQDYHMIATEDSVADVQAKLTSEQEESLGIIDESQLVTQQIRYYLPEAGEVFLGWGINGWNVVPEEIRPAGTTVKNSVMNTPMAREDDAFVAKVRVPFGSTIDYGFLVTKKRNGAAIKAIWDGRKDYHMIATEDSVADVQTTLTLEHARELPEWLVVGLYLLAGIFILSGIGVMLTRVPRLDNPRTMALLLIGMTLLGLTLRLWIASTNQRLLDTPAHLIGDEHRYEHLAHSLLQGSFFQRPLATPVYPLFLAACYLIFGHSYGAVFIVQAFIGATAIPLTYLLARNFIGKRSSLFAALLIAIQPNLIYQVQYLYTEVVFTFLFLLTMLGLVWALKVPLKRRFLISGAALGISTLCRPGTALMPPILFLFMPKSWNIKHRVALFCVFSGAMVAVIVPWAYHNYRTHNTFLPFSLSMTMLWHGSPEFYHLMEQKENAMLKVWDEELNPALNDGHDPLTIEGDRYFNARAMASIRAEPGLYIWYSLQKLAFFWIGHPAAHYDWPFNLDMLRISFSAGEIAGIFGSRLLLVLAALSGLVVLRHRLGAFLPLLTTCGYFMLVYAILNPVARYSEPLYPILVIFVVAATERLVLRYQVDIEEPAPHVQTAPITM